MARESEKHRIRLVEYEGGHWDFEADCPVATPGTTERRIREIENLARAWASAAARGDRRGVREHMRKTLVTSIHTNKGIDRIGFVERFEEDPGVRYRAEFDALDRLGLLGIADDVVVPTEIGRFFRDELSVSLYSPTVREKLASEGMKYGMFFRKDRYV